MAPDQTNRLDGETERLRRSGVRLDRAGRFWHEGAEITHAGIRRAFLRWLDRLADGRPILRLDDARFVFLDIDADATPLLVTALREAESVLVVTTNDGAEEPLDLESLVVETEGGARCAVRGGRLEARFLSPAYHALADRLDVGIDGTVRLLLGERWIPVRLT